MWSINIIPVKVPRVACMYVDTAKKDLITADQALLIFAHGHFQSSAGTSRESHPWPEPSTTTYSNKKDGEMKEGKAGRAKE